MAAPPERPLETRQQLDQVSILFLDVVGSTTLRQCLDPEAIGAVMDDALSRGTAIVEAHRGRVLQYAGDVLQAAFRRRFEQRKLAAVTVVAEAGIGKSRLRQEFEAWSAARPESFFRHDGPLVQPTARSLVP